MIEKLSSDETLDALKDWARNRYGNMFNVDEVTLVVHAPRNQQRRIEAQFELSLKQGEDSHPELTPVKTG